MKNFFLKYSLYLVPAIMLFFFIRNLVLTNTENMDAWMGGAMRMFSSVDKMLYRVAGFTAEADGKTYFVNFRNVESMANEDAYLRVMPAENRLKKVLSAVESKSWCRDTISGSLVPCNGIASQKSVKEFKVKSISVYKVVFDKEANKISLAQLNQYSKQ